MKLRIGTNGCAAVSLAALAGLFAASAWAANDPVSGDPLLGEAAVEVEPVELLEADALEILVAPVALYPDDLLAVVLPASTYPLQVVLAARFLEADQVNADGEEAQPSEEWDDAVVALLNYPEVVALLDGNLDWTRRLGEAVLVQEEDVITAISAFREQAKKAGNLESDDKQEVAVNDAGAIEIKPAVPDEIYVPYYEPEEVVVRQPVRVYHYYPRSYPVYYYPYHQGYDFGYRPFWGVTSAFSIGWHTRNLHLHHYGFNDHPYYSYRYHDPFYYRRPHVVLNFYDRDRRHRQRHRSDRYHRGNDWRSERSKRDHRRWTARSEGRHGDGRGDDRQRGDRPGQSQREQGPSIAPTLRTGTTPTVHQPTKITPLGEGRTRPTPTRPVANRAQTAGPGAASAGSSPRQRAERQPSHGWRTERRAENTRLPQSRSQVSEPVATYPTQRPIRVQPTDPGQRSSGPARPTANQPRQTANTPHQARQTQRAEQSARERFSRQAPVSPRPPSSVGLRRGAPVNRTLPPNARRPQAADQQVHSPVSRRAVQQARPRPNLSRSEPHGVQQSSPITRQAAQHARQPRLNPQARARVERPATAARPAPTERRVERTAPQRPVRARPGPSGEDPRSRRPR